MSYDIFISYKVHDTDGYETRDFAIARELHGRLMEMGYSVFFSEQSLEEIGSSKYKSDIDNALDSAKIMIVVLTDPNFATTRWVKYEWDSFYNDYLSGIKNNVALFTLTKDLNIHDLPRTLRDVQNFNYVKNGINKLCDYINSFLSTKNKFTTIIGRQVSAKDIEQAIELDCIVYEEDIYHVNKKRCMEWFNVNHDIYVMIRDNESNKIISYVNISPVTFDCYEQFRNGNLIDADITADMLLSYDMPGVYDICILSVAIYPDYRNTCVLSLLLNAVVERFLNLANEEKFIKRVVAEAVTKEGDKFCKIFGMTKVKDSNRKSTLYEVSMLPPKFRIISKTFRQLFEYYTEEHTKNPWLSDGQN